MRETAERAFWYCVAELFGVICIVPDQWRQSVSRFSSTCSDNGRGARRTFFPDGSETRSHLVLLFLLTLHLLWPRIEMASLMQCQGPDELHLGAPDHFVTSNRRPSPLEDHEVKVGMPTVEARSRTDILTPSASGMSFGRPGGFGDSFKVTPPQRGSFPLDHDGEYIVSLKTAPKTYIPTYTIAKAFQAVRATG